MMAPTDRKTPIKVAGYLEKRSKMKVVSRWKKLWFVLEGRLLLYYKSQLEYLSLSPCRGTVNLGLAASVAPGKSNEIIVSTRSNTVFLRALTRSDHDIWLQALMDAMHLPNTSHSICCAKPVKHFRYSAEFQGLDEQHSKTYGNFTNHSQTLSERLSPMNSKYIAEERKQGAKDIKLKKIAQRFNKIAASDSTIPENFHLGSGEILKNNLLRRSLSVEDEMNRYSENIYETVDSTKIQQRTPRRVIRSDSDCFLVRERLPQKTIFRSEQRIKSIFAPSYSNENEVFNNILYKNRHDKTEKFFKTNFGENRISDRIKDVKSDTDLTFRKKESRINTGSCNIVYQPCEVLQSSNSNEYCYCRDCIRNQDILKQPIVPKISKKTKRTNSILKHFIRDKNDVCNPLGKKNSMKRRSLSFLKRIWRKKEPIFEDDISFNTEENDMQEIHYPDSEMIVSSNYSAMEMSLEYEAPLPEPLPDYTHTEVDNDKAPELPPRRGPTPWDEPFNKNQESLEDKPPPLPIKMRKRRGNALDFLFHDGWDPGLRHLFYEGEDNSQKELGEIMAQLSDINAGPLKNTNVQENDEPAYDIPRPHDSLLLNLPKNRSSPDKMQPTNFFSHFEDSLDLPQSRFEDLNMAPDSLECDPWSLSESDSTSENWTPQTQIRKLSSPYDSNQETYFVDSLNLPNRKKDYYNIQNGFIQLHT